MESRMSRRTKGIWLLALLLLCLGLASPQWTLAVVADYCDSCNPDAIPPFLGGEKDPPMVMIAASNDHQLYFKAYNDTVDLDGDGVVDTTYKYSITYYGYFDSSKCYDYNTTDLRFEPKASTDADHYCTGANDSYWSGNFLNWISMSRIDVIRKVLFGGHRRVDTATTTILERTYLPHDAHSWAKYYNGADLDKLTPFSVAGGHYTLTDADLKRNGLTFANTTDTSSTGYSQAITDPPLIKVAKGNYSLWASNERWQCTWASGAPKDNHAADNSNAAASGINAYTSSPDFSKGVGQMNYVARVQACVPTLIGTEKCKQYPSGNYKPLGLLQVYGDANQMYFGMVAGSYDQHASGGSLIRNVGKMSDEINVSIDGTFPLVAVSAGGTKADADAKGLINAWSLYRIVGYDHGDGYYNDSAAGGDNCSWGLSAFGTVTDDGRCKNWGNPFSEIFYQAINYFAGGGVIGAYYSDDSSFISGLSKPEVYNDPLLDSTINPSAPHNYCGSLNIVNFNSSIPSYDADGLDSNLATTGIWNAGDIPGNTTAMTNAVGDSDHEGINGNDYFIGQTAALTDQLCTEKEVTSLGEAQGMCPDAPRMYGSFREAGLAYYAHTEDIRAKHPLTDNGELTIDTFSVAMAPSVPTIEIPDPSNPSVTAVTLLPACRNTALSPAGNCAVVDFKIVSQAINDGHGVGSGKFYINWEDSEQGGDYDQDMWGVLEYTINANTISITTQVIAQSTGYSMGFGYVLSGTTNDGFHAHSGICGFTYTDTTDGTDELGPDCHGGDGCNCRSGHGTCTVDGPSTKVYALAGAAGGLLLKDPLWYASKWGGFADGSGSGTITSTAQWDKTHNATGGSGADGLPDNYFYATNPGQLEDALARAFGGILGGMASGSAASVVSSTRSGDGAIYQAVFWPVSDLVSGAKWTGEVHSLFVDGLGNTYEDTNGNRQLETHDIYAADGVTIIVHADQKVVLYYNTSEKKTMACYGTLDSSGQCPSPYIYKSLAQVKFLWSAAESLYNITNGNITTNRSDITVATDAAYISAVAKRNIFTWNDLDNNGIVDSGEVLPFVADWDSKPVNTDNDAIRGSRDTVIYKDFGVASQTDMNNLINWIRGLDQTGMRTRDVNLDTNGDGVGEGIHYTWRLSDIINSTPMVVGRPAENYDLLYRDRTYAEFAAHYMNRRNVIYAGGNDGMLHAFNGGFYQEKLKGFCLSDTVDTNGNCSNEAGKPALGSELWAYVPYNLAPHLKCLASPLYCHKYYVDLRPRIFDVRIFQEEAACDPDRQDPACFHPYGWGTVLVGGMRFGGAPVSSADLGLIYNDLAHATTAPDNRIFASSYFVFDITNPENPPVLLGETTHMNGVTAEGTAEAQLGYTTDISSMVPMITDVASNNTDWYLIFGNGPSDLQGNSTLKPTVFVMPMDWLAGTTGTPHELRFPSYTATLNTALGHDFGAFALPLSGTSSKGFVSDPITVDFELLPDYKANAVYMGTVEHNPAYPATSTNPWLGEMFRLVTGERSYDGTGNLSQATLTPMDWKVNLLFDAQRPISSASSVGLDGINYWIYFGTGRFHHANLDTLDHTRQSYFGIKEPMTHALNGTHCEHQFTWETVEKTPLAHNAIPGSAGLLDVTPISILASSATVQSTEAPSSTLHGQPYQALIDYIAGTPVTGCAKDNNGTDGWYRDFQMQTTSPPNNSDFAERNLGQATLLGGLLTFTTYNPFISSNGCDWTGTSNIYGLYYQTGTAWKSPVFGGSIAGEIGGNVVYNATIGEGMTTTPNLLVGSGPGTTAFVQTSTGAIIAIEQPNLPVQTGKTGRKSWFEGIPTTP